MALQKFANKIVKGDSIQIFNNGNHQRDFTYIDDIVEGVLRVLDQPASSNLNWSSSKPDPSSSNAPWKVYNLGNNKPVKLMDYIEALEKALGKKAKKEYLPIQPGDVPNTWANVDELVKQFDYQPNTSVEKGITKFTHWFKEYYKV